MDILKDLPSGAVVAYIIWQIIREVLVAVRKRTTDKNQSGVLTSGDQPTSYWRAEIQDVMTRVVRETVLPLEERQTHLLEAIQDTQQQMAQVLTELKTMVSITSQQQHIQVLRRNG